MVLLDSCKLILKITIEIKVNLNDIAVHDKSSQSYEASLAVWDHTYYLPPDTSELAPPNPSQTGWYSIYLPRRDGRLSSPIQVLTWPSVD